MFKRILVVMAFCAALAYAGTCGGNCPSGRCTSCKCPATPKHVDIASACSKFSGWNQKCCQCIISHESGGNQYAQLENTNGSNDVGLWQVNSMNWASCNGGRAPCDLNENLQCAKKVFAWGGNTFKLWSTCGACGCCGHVVEESLDSLE